MIRASSWIRQGVRVLRRTLHSVALTIAPLALSIGLLVGIVVVVELALPDAVSATTEQLLGLGLLSTMVAAPSAVLLIGAYHAAQEVAP